MSADTIAGVVQLPALREFTQDAAPDGGPRLRIATTSYMGATDLKLQEQKHILKFYI